MPYVIHRTEDVLNDISRVYSGSSKTSMKLIEERNIFTRKNPTSSDNDFS